MVLDELTPADFEPLIGSAFLLTAQPDRPSLTLVAVERFETQPHAPRPQPFSLVFASEPGRQLSQQIHPLEHAALGRLDLFLVPIGPGLDGLPRYEAAFN